MKFGIKFKILLGISSLLIVCTAFNLGYSYKLFTEDKTSYIFENGLKKAENISDQINFKLTDLIARTEFNLLLLNTPAVNFEKLINGQNEIIMTGILINKEGKLTGGDEFLNTKIFNKITNSHGVKSSDLSKEIIENSSPGVMTTRSKNWVYSPRPDLKFLIYVSKNQNDDNLIFSVSDFSPLLEIFSKDRVYTNKIISLSNAKDRLANAEWISKVDFKKSKKGAFETQIKNEDVLLSYVFVNDKILVLSAINKAEAF
ncbi:MAG: hypothetical protein Q7U04_00595, partial [Bacteriovorax sp.]|nr:hypothetical protein [Bacteriovorax sp.]